MVTTGASNSTRGNRSRHIAVFLRPHDIVQGAKCMSKGATPKDFAAFV
jgi:hypothetical protein